jgi:DNA-binding SARP family transcriptional activator
MHSPEDMIGNGRPGDASVPVVYDTPRAGRGELLSQAFELCPWGMGIADLSGRIVACNPALQDTLGMGVELRGKSCCDLFGCRTPGGPLDGTCLTDAAIDARGTAGELIVTLPGTERSVWITAAPIYGGDSRIVFQIRPAEQGNTDLPDPQTSTATPRLRLFTLGRMRVETPDGPIPGEWLEQRSGQLLKFLICQRDNFVSTDEIAEAVWPNPHPATPNTVRHFVHSLRERLEPGRPQYARSSVVLARRGGYMLNREGIWIDADEFEAKVQSGLAAFAAGQRGTAVEELERALSLYRGDFLAEEPYAEWALAERERLRELAEKPLRTLSELRADDLDLVAGYLERLAEMEPFDHEVQRQLLTVWMRQGRRSRVVRWYHAFQLRLLREFDEQPYFSLSELVLPHA